MKKRSAQALPDDERSLFADQIGEIVVHMDDLMRVVVDLHDHVIAGGTSEWRKQYFAEPADRHLRSVK